MLGLGVVPRSLGGTIRHRRRQIGLTLDELATAAAMSKPYLSLIETRRANPPSDDVLQRLEAALRLPPSALKAMVWLHVTPPAVLALLADLLGRPVSTELVGDVAQVRAVPARSGDDFNAATGGGEVAAMSNPTPTHGLTPVMRRPRAGGPPAHAGWCKRINGRTRWVCSAATAPTAADADAFYRDHFAELWAGPTPASPDVVTLGVLAEYFVDRKLRAGLSVRTAADYREAAQSFIDAVGTDRPIAELTPADFARVRSGWAERFGPHRLAKFVAAARSMFLWASRPPLSLPTPAYGDEFERPTRLAFRRHRSDVRRRLGPRTFTPAELAAVLAVARPAVRAMVLFGLNGGLGNADVAGLPLAAVDLASGWIDCPRAKAGVDRRFPLWPETADALRVAMAERDEAFARWHRQRRTVPAAVAELLFVTRQRGPFISDDGDGHKDRVAAEFARACRRAQVDRRGRGFYSLRRTFRTQADGAGDQRAAALVVGYEVGDMGGVYVEQVDDARLLAVVEHVRIALAITGREGDFDVEV